MLIGIAICIGEFMYYQPEEGCEQLPKVLNTNYDELKIVVDQHVSAKIHRVESSMLDINLQMHILLSSRKVSAN